VIIIDGEGWIDVLAKTADTLAHIEHLRDIKLA